ncbi:MAG: hypothetical protein AABX60_02305 [Nanoarchaeota archaeon]
MLVPARLVKLYCIFPKRLLDTVAARLQRAGTVHLIDAKEGNRLLNGELAGCGERLERLLEE